MPKGKYAAWLEPEGLKQLESWAHEGLTDRQIARQIGCDPSTLRSWMQRYPPVLLALLRGRNELCSRVEDALLMCALGYQSTERHQECSTDPKTGLKKVTLKKIVKDVHPSTTALLFWLKNRYPERWKSDPSDPGEQANLEAARKLLESIPSTINDGGST